MKTKVNGIARTYTLSTNQKEASCNKNMPLPIVRMQPALHQCSSRVPLFFPAMPDSTSTPRRQYRYLNPAPA